MDQTDPAMQVTVPAARMADPGGPRATLAQALAAAADRQKRGDLQGAASLYRQILREQPEHAACLNNLGVIACQSGAVEEGLDLIARAVANAPRHGEYRVNLGRALQARGRNDEALAAFEAAVAAAPELAEAHFRLGAALRAAGRLAEAVAVLCRAVELRPDAASAWSNLGNVLRELGRDDDALSAYLRAVGLEPRLAETQFNLGLLLRQRRDVDGAIAALRRAVTVKPAFAEALYNLADLMRARQPAAALNFARRAAQLRGDRPELRVLCGLILMDLARPVEAEADYRQAIAARADYPAAHLDLALCLLLRGQLEEGWREFEWRWRARYFPTKWRDFGVPVWSGEATVAGTLLLWGEQGVGDQILHAGMVAEMMPRARRIVLECEPRLVPLFRRSFPGVELAPRQDPSHPRTRANDIVSHAPLGSLGRWLRADPAAFPRRNAYLRADDARTAALRARYRALGPGPVIGISWRSSLAYLGPAKTTALEDWAPILRVPEANFVNLQYGDCAAELAEVRDQLGVVVHHDPAIDPLRDLDAFAAQVAAMDLVVSVSNSTVHFAGALGVPVWALLPAGAGLMWYWFLEREDSPWYPTLRLFRQPKLGDWPSAIARVAAALPRGGGPRRPGIEGE